MVLAVGLFSIMDAMVKWVGPSYPTFEIVFFRACLWRIRTHAATGSSKRPPQCFSQVKLLGAAGCVTTLPVVSAGVSPSNDGMCS